jgi:hypothetical protein
MITAKLFGSETCSKCSLIKQILKTKANGNWEYIQDKEILKENGIELYPTLIFYKDNVELERVNNREGLIKKINEYFGG